MEEMKARLTIIKPEVEKRIDLFIPSQELISRAELFSFLADRFATGEWPGVQGLTGGIGQVLFLLDLLFTLRV